MYTCWRYKILPVCEDNTICLLGKVEPIFINKDEESKMPMHLGKRKANKYLKEISGFRFCMCFMQGVCLKEKIVLHAERMWMSAKEACKNFPTPKPSNSNTYS